MCTAKCLIAALHVAHTGALLLPSNERLQVTPDIPDFDAFLETYGRSYRSGSAEYGMRRSLYEGRAAAAAQQNSQGARLWTAGVSFLWDYTDEEFAQLRGWQPGARPGQDREGSLRGSSGRAGLMQLGGPTAPTAPAQGHLQALPPNKSWAHLKTFADVPNQGPCGSCWAIAGARVLQAHAEIHTGVLRTFSAQQLVSCVPNPKQCGGAGGCEGATVELAYAWVMKNGLADSNQVPYWANDSQCFRPEAVSLQSSKSPVAGGAAAFGMTGWERLHENGYKPLKRALVERGPVAVSAAARPWGLYKNGIFDGCPPDVTVDHAVVLIGYGADASVGGVLFWDIQNSWGKFWGEEGRIRLLRHDEERAHCGTNFHPEMGTGCIGGPPNVTVCGTCAVLYDSVVPFF